MTSALAPEMISGLLDVTVELAREGMIMMVVAHEKALASGVAGWMVVMDAGTILEDAPTAGFFDAPRTERAKLLLSEILCC